MNIFKNPLYDAIARAQAEAGIRRAKVADSLDPGRVAQVLGEEAENLRLSPLAYDQLLALALEAAASPEGAISPVLKALRREPNPIERFQLRRHVFAAFDVLRARAVAKAAPDWALRRAEPSERADASRLAKVLRVEANLNAEFWDHPSLPVAPELRALMLACVDPLRRKANALARAGSRARRADLSRVAPQGAPA
ncbi:hypothetical protein [Phenylobacterium sp.]|uniref:hypothetical protein n=1 Tax=Phenylobacterium sp. TaxID=1871053 RepID=UPI002FE05927